MYYIQHEILSEKEENIVDFMAGSVPEGVTRETVVNTLKEVGFDDAKMAAMKMRAMEDKLNTIENRKERKKYIKQCEASIKQMYMEQLKNMTIGEGQVLMKLLHRETGKTSWEIMRNYRGTTEALFWQAFGSFY